MREQRDHTEYEAAAVHVLTGPAWQAPPGGHSSAGAQVGTFGATADERTAVIVSGDGVRTVSLAGGTPQKLELERLATEPVPPAFSPNQRFALIGCKTRTPEPQGCVVDLVAQRALAFRAPLQAPVAISNDGELAVVADGAKLRVIDLSASALRREACTRAGRALARTEWDRFFTGPYAPRCARDR